jgi:hypothetical protein
MIRVGVTALGATAVAIAVLWLQPTPPRASSTAIPIATSEVTRGTLLDTKTVTGTLEYGELTALRPNLTVASAMVTWIAPEGATVNRGEPLYRLDGQPAILFYGSVPQHRTLRFDRDAVSPVWVELEQAGIAVKAAELTLRLEQQRLADAETRITDATARLEDALLPSPSTAEFIQLSGAVGTAEAKVARMRELAAAQLTPIVNVAAAGAELSVARAAFDASVRALRKDLAVAGLDAVTARVAVNEAEVKLDAFRTTHDSLATQATDESDSRQIADNLAALGYTGALFEQVRAWQRDAGLAVTGIVDPGNLVLAAGPVHIADHKASIGETLVDTSPDRGSILDYSSTEKLVTLPLNVGDRGLAAIDRIATITLPDDTKVKGVISKVGSVVTDGSIAVTISIADQAALDALEVASVDVELVSSSRENVFSVPVGALLALANGRFAVEVVSDGKSTVVPVDTGLFGAGRVEITGKGIADGLHVGVPR